MPIVPTYVLACPASEREPSPIQTARYCSRKPSRDCPGIRAHSDYGLLPRDPEIAALSTKVGEFMRRFLLHVLPKGFHRIRHYGLLASAGRTANIARPRTPRCTEGRMQRNRQCGCPRAGRSAAAMPMLWRSHDHHRDLRARQRRPRAAIGRLRKQDWRVMTANGHHHTAIPPKNLSVGGRMSARPCARSQGSHRLPR